MYKVLVPKKRKDGIWQRYLCKNPIDLLEQRKKQIGMKKALLKKMEKKILLEGHTDYLKRMKKKVEDMPVSEIGFKEAG